MSPAPRAVLPIALALAAAVGAAGNASAQTSVPTESAWRPATGPLMTRWAADVRPDAALPEYPRPQMVRARWQNLNGLWDLALVADSAAPMPLAGPFPERVLVPFPIESALSGVMKHAPRAVYRRAFRAPDLARGERLLVHFGAVDWKAEVHVNGQKVGEHTGGYGAFSFDVTDALRPGGAQEIVVAVTDPTDTFGQPRGKQVGKPEGIFYTSVTGIWQTVWLEPVPAASIESLRMTPDVAGRALRLTVRGRGAPSSQRVRAVAMAGGREVGRVEGTVGTEMRVPVPNPRLWGPDDPFLYDLRVTLVDGGREIDRVDSYFGMRTIGLVDRNGQKVIALNGEPWFHVGPLDQGWWPDGLYTAPTDEALAFDVERTLAAGFNFTRKHIKVEPARWYHHADRLGLPVWQDMPSGWNDTPEARAHFEAELREMLEQLGNHPSIVVWVPFNEKWGQTTMEWTREIAASIQQADPSRLVDDASGWQHAGAGHIVDVHRYQGPQALVPSADKATVLGEYGGLGFPVAGHLWRVTDSNWGYGGAYRTQGEMNDRYDLLMKRTWRLRDTHGMSAAVYTQLTDVETEVNGLFTYDRAVFKFDTARVAAVNRGLAPLILPEHPDFTDSVRVTVHQGTPTEIRHTVDGTEPTASSPVFQPFTVTENTTVRVRAFRDGRPLPAPEARMEYRKTEGRPAVDGVSVVPGIDYAYYADRSPEPHFRFEWRVRWALERLNREANDPAPVKTGTLAGFDLSPRDQEEMFGFRYTGFLRVPKTGVYTFSALSDDGVSLWIGDHNVFWSMGGLSPAVQEDAGEIALQAGLHPFTLSYHQAYGPMEMRIFVEGPGMARQPVPASMLFRPAPR